MKAMILNYLSKQKIRQLQIWSGNTGWKFQLTQFRISNTGTFPVTQWLRDQPSSAQEMVSLVEKVRSHTPRVTKHPSYWAHNYWDKSKPRNEDLKKEREKNLKSYFFKLRIPTLSHHLMSLAPPLPLTHCQTLFTMFVIQPMPLCAWQHRRSND